jgi:hypothetical protein
MLCKLICIFFKDLNPHQIVGYDTHMELLQKNFYVLIFAIFKPKVDEKLTKNGTHIL